MRALLEKNVKVVSDFINQNLDDLLVDRIDEYLCTIFDYIFNVPVANELIEKLILKASEKFLKKGALPALNAAAEIGNIKAVKLILHKYKDLLVFERRDGLLPIHRALMGGRTTNRETVEFLLSAHAAREIKFDQEFPLESSLVLFLLIRVGYIG